MPNSITIYTAELRFKEEPDYVQDRKEFFSQAEAEDQLAAWEYALDENMILLVHASKSPIH